MTKKLLLTCSAVLLLLSSTIGGKANPVYVGPTYGSIDNTNHFSVSADIGVSNRALSDSFGAPNAMSGYEAKLSLSSGASESFQKAYTAVFGTAAPSRDLSVANGLSLTAAAIPNNISTQSAPGCTPPRPVPEPATLLLLGGGLAGVAATLRRRRTKKLEAQVN